MGTDIRLRTPVHTLPRVWAGVLRVSTPFTRLRRGSRSPFSVPWKPYQSTRARTQVSARTVAFGEPTTARGHSGETFWNFMPHSVRARVPVHITAPQQRVSGGGSVFPCPGDLTGSAPTFSPCPPQNRRSSSRCLRSPRSSPRARAEILALVKCGDLPLISSVAEASGASSGASLRRSSSRHTKTPPGSYARQQSRRERRVQRES